MEEGVGEQRGQGGRGAGGAGQDGGGEGEGGGAAGPQPPEAARGRASLPKIH